MVQEDKINEANDVIDDNANEANTAQKQNEKDNGEQVTEKQAKKPKQANKSESEISSLKALNEKLNKELESTKETLLRTAAEYENFRKRSLREKEMSFSGGLIHAVQALLPILDTLVLAVNVETQDENFKKGVQLTLDQCNKSFDVLGVKEMQALGEMFDPNMHAAVMQQPAEDGVESGTVTQVLQPGYTLGDKVIRHATVAVAD